MVLVTEKGKFTPISELERPNNKSGMPIHHPLDPVETIALVEDLFQNFEVKVANENPPKTTKSLLLPITEEWLLETITNMEEEGGKVSIWEESLKPPETYEEAKNTFLDWFKKESEEHEKILGSLGEHPKKNTLIKNIEMARKRQMAGTIILLNWLEDNSTEEIYEKVEAFGTIVSTSQWLILKQMELDLTDNKNEGAILEITELKKSLITEMLKTKNNKYIIDPMKLWNDMKKLTINNKQIQASMDELFIGMLGEVYVAKTLENIFGDKAEIEISSAYDDVQNGVDIAVAKKNGTTSYIDVKVQHNKIDVADYATYKFTCMGTDNFSLTNGANPYRETSCNKDKLQHDLEIPRSLIYFLAEKGKGTTGISIRIPSESIFNMEAQYRTNKEEQLIKTLLEHGGIGNV